MVKDAKHKPAPCKRLVNLVLNAGIIAAALKLFAMESMDDEPTQHIISDVLKTSIKAVCQRYFYKVFKEFIQTYVVDRTLYANQFTNIQALQEWETAQANQTVLPNGRYPCQFAGCSSSYKYGGIRRRRHELSHDLHPPFQEFRLWSILHQIQLIKIMHM